MMVPVAIWPEGPNKHGLIKRSETSGLSVKVNDQKMSHVIMVTEYRNGNENDMGLRNIGNIKNTHSKKN